MERVRAEGGARPQKSGGADAGASRGDAGHARDGSRGYRRAARGMDRGRGVLRRARSRGAREERETAPARGGDGEEDVRSTMDGFGVRSLARRDCGEAPSSRRGESSDGADHALTRGVSVPLVDRQGA